MKSTSIACQDLTKIQGTSTPLLAGLGYWDTDESYHSLTGKQVQFVINGLTYNRTTNDNGFVSMAINLPVGDYPVVVRFNGDSEYSPCSTTVNVHVTPKLKANLIVDDLVKTIGTSTPLRARLLYDNQPLVGETVSFLINDVWYDRTTDSDGYVSMAINLDIGAYSTTVYFADNRMYEVETKHIMVRVVDKPKINLTVYNLVKTYGTSDQLIARISDTGAFITGYRIEFTINGVTYTRETDVNGDAHLNINLRPGVYPCRVRYAGDSQFSETIKEVTVTVKADTMIDGFSITKFVGDADQYQCAVYDPWTRLNPCSVDLTINGVTYTRHTNDEGLIRLNINLGPGEYPITVRYNGDDTHNPSVRRGDVVTVKPRIQTLSTVRSDGLVVPGPNQGHMESRIYVAGITPDKAKELNSIADLPDWGYYLGQGLQPINFTSYEIQETDPRVKTAKFTTDKYYDLTNGRQWVYITSPYHENFGGKLLKVDYDKDKGLYTYQCQDGRRQYLSKTRTISVTPTRIYDLIELCLIRPALIGTGFIYPISDEDRVKYGSLLTGLRPLEEYMMPPSEQIILSDYNPLDQEMGDTLTYDSLIDKIMNVALASNTGSIDVHFTPDGVCQLEPVDFEKWLNTGFRLTHTDLVQYKYGFDTTNILTGVTVQTPTGDATVKDTEGRLLNDSTLDLSYYFGMNIGMISPVTMQVTTEGGDTSSGSSSSSNTGTGRFKDKTIVVGCDTNVPGDDSYWHNTTVDTLRNAGYTVEALDIGPGPFSNYDWYGPSQGKVGVYLMADSTVSIADYACHDGFDYCVFGIRGDAAPKANREWTTAPWAPDDDCNGVCNNWAYKTGQEKDDMLNEMGRGRVVPGGTAEELANNILAALNGDSVGTASASNTTTENQPTTTTVVNDAETYRKALDEMSKSVRNLLSFEVKLPLNHPMFKELHTNMFLWTQLPSEFKLGNLAEIFKFMGSWRQNRGFSYVENRWYIEKNTIKCDSNGLFATLTLNAFPSSYSHYASAFRDYSKAYDQAFRQQQETTDNNSGSSSGGVGEARLGDDCTETNDMACASSRGVGNAGDNENFDECAKRGYAQEGRGYYNWARQYNSPLELCKAMVDRFEYHNHSDNWYCPDHIHNDGGTIYANCYDACRYVKVCMDSCGFDCVIITGSPYGIGHGWNAVKHNGRWYSFDLCYPVTGSNWQGTNSLRMCDEW